MSTELLEILLTLLLSAFFSGAEIAFVSSNKLLFKVEKRKNNLTASILNLFYKNSNQFISTMLIGNNISLVTYGLLMARALTPYFNPYITEEIWILLCQSLIATGLILFSGEFIPRTIAISNPNLFLTITAIPLFFVYIILYPVSKLISGFAWLFLKTFGIKLPSGKNISTFGKDDLDDFIQKSIQEAPQNTQLDKEMELFQNALEFSNIRVRDCVVPRTEIVAVSTETTLEELLSKFIETGLSKILVFKEDIDNIIGYIHSSEMFTKPDDWTQSIISLPFVPENMAANKLMKNMLEEKRNIAVVVDEFGGTSGVITLEDLVEEIFGEIEDEHDTRNLISKQINENEYILSGRAEIDQINENFRLNIPESDEYQTIAGYILSYNQSFPKVNELISIDRYTFKIIKMSNTKIELVRLKVSK
ncbi:MAG: hemolysin family protein [Dysgonamonadaceae bacterium]|jgi:CBS domain containing-hemolysin-like protein|nr:hemolysin family protein [Dysgonamonadaceae bacterium]